MTTYMDAILMAVIFWNAVQKNKINKNQTAKVLSNLELVLWLFCVCILNALIHNSKAHVRIYEILFQKIIGLMNSKINRKISKFSVKSSDIGRIIYCIQRQGAQKLKFMFLWRIFPYFSIYFRICESNYIYFSEKTSALHIHNITLVYRVGPVSHLVSIYYNDLSIRGGSRQKFQFLPSASRLSK